MPRCPQNPGGLFPARPCWSGTGHRHAPECRRGRSCRTGRRSDSRPPPSLSRVTPSAVSEHFSELLGCPISRSLTTSCVRLELRPLPSPSITRLQRYYGPLRHPRAPGLSLAGVQLVIPDHALGLPVLRMLSLCTCCRHYPGAAAGRTTSLIRPAVSAFPERVVGSACASSFSRCYGADGGETHHRHLRQYADGASHVTTQRLEQVPHFPGARQHDHCGNRDESIELARRRHCSRHRAPSAEEA